MNSIQRPVFPAKAGTQIHPERWHDVTWAPAFAGEAGFDWAEFAA